jgi:hypothetical protein
MGAGVNADDIDDAGADVVVDPYLWDGSGNVGHQTPSGIPPSPGKYV